jgi:hypothetical protein
MRPYDEQQFMEWDKVQKWVIDEATFDRDFPSSPKAMESAGAGSLAAYILTTIFSLPLDSSSGRIGGSLPGYDVMNRDAYQIIQLSLAEELKYEKIYECHTDGNGTVKFYPIGVDSFSPGRSLLYAFETAELKQQCDSVVVTGYDPPQKKFFRGSYDLFTFANTYSPDDFLNKSSPFYDADLGSYPLPWCWTEVLGPKACTFAREGYIEYGNPFWDNSHFDAMKKMEDAGVVKPREFEQMVEGLYEITIPFYREGSTQVEFRNTTPRYVDLKEGFGNLIPRVWKSGNAYYSQYCLGEQEVSRSDYAKYGVVLPRSNERKFRGVKEVCVYGIQLNTIAPAEIFNTASRTASKDPNYDFVVDINSLQPEPFKLNQGDDYIVVKDGDKSDSLYRIIFAHNMNPVWAADFGGSVAGATKNLKISTSCIYETNPTDITVASYNRVSQNFFAEAGTSKSAFLRSGETISTQTMSNACIFPTGEGTTGYVVQKIVVVYEWENPCVAILDQSDLVTLDNLKLVKINLHPIIIKDLPPPVSRNGVLLDPRQSMLDLDVTTFENLSANPWNQAMSGLENGDVSLTLPFLEADECNKVSRMILRMQQDVQVQTTYVCDPSATPELGQVIDGKTINSIDYSYQDSSQYLITIQAGPLWQGIGGWDQSSYKNQTDQVQAEGVVRGVFDNNMRCQVFIPKFGVIECVNATKDLLEKGDTVKVTLRNNPVSD